jgi:predicted aldo/keto reductase-like oxidoreductase
VDHIGFTTHAAPDDVIKMMETGTVETVTIGFHLLHHKNEKVLSRAHELGLGVIIMNPLAGGMFSEPAEYLQAKLNMGAASMVDIGLRYVLSCPPVSSALSGMRTVAEVEENARIAADGRLYSPAEMTHLNTVVAGFRKEEAAMCSTCGYCQPCPQEVNIPHILKQHNKYVLYGFKETAKRDYHRIGKSWIKGNKADACIECGVCEPKCPSKLDIMNRLKQCREWFGD